MLRLKWTLFDLQSVIQTVKALTLILQVYLHLVLRLAMFPGYLHRLTNLSILQWFCRMNCKMLKHWKRTLFDLQSMTQTVKALTLILQVHLHLVLRLVLFLGYLHHLTNPTILQWFSRMNCKMRKRWKRTLLDLLSLKQTGKALII